MILQFLKHFTVPACYFVLFQHFRLCSTLAVWYIGTYFSQIQCVYLQLTGSSPQHCVIFVRFGCCDSPLYQIGSFTDDCGHLVCFGENETHCTRIENPGPHCGYNESRSFDGAN